MNIDNILKLANEFQAMAAAEKEELPKDSDNISKVLKNIEKLDTYSARKEYAERNLKHLSSGSSRIVYLTPQKTIIKLAKNDRGIAQNKAEANPKVKSKYLNKILGHSKKFEWIETCYLDKITEKQFKEMIGFHFEDFGECIRYALRDVSSNKDLDKPKSYKKIEEDNFFKEMVKIGKKNNLMPGDLARISSWLTNGKIPILGDAGLTKDIFKTFYEST